jgi:hypothetical protein
MLHVRQQMKPIFKAKSNNGMNPDRQQSYAPGMNEDQVLQAVIQWFATRGSRPIYQTRPVAESAIGGVDAILYDPQQCRYTFIDAKGTAAEKVKRSTSFTNSLGSLIKRIRFETGYSGLEAKARFTPLESRARLSHAPGWLKRLGIVSATTFSRLRPTTGRLSVPLSTQILPLSFTSEFLSSSQIPFVSSSGNARVHYNNMQHGLLSV